MHVGLKLSKHQLSRFMRW